MAAFHSDMKNETQQIFNRLAYVHTKPETAVVSDRVDGDHEDQEVVVADPDHLVLALLISSSSNLIIVLIYWAHLIYASCPYKSNHSNPALYPHFLLLGLCLGSASSLIQVSLEPNIFPISLTSLLLPISYSSMYSSLFVRLIYLRSLHKGIYLPSFYQVLLLLFCVLVQISLTLQLLFLLNNALNVNSHTLQPDLLSLSYVVFLLMSCIGLSTLQLRSTEHYNEARAIWAFCFLSMAVWIIWVSCGLIFGNYYQIIKGLEANVTALILLLLVPKNRRLTYLGKDKFKDLRRPRGSSILGSGYLTDDHFRRYKDSSYMGFHRPKLVVPPSLSSGSPSSGTIYGSYGSSSHLLRSTRPRMIFRTRPAGWLSPNAVIGGQKLPQFPNYCCSAADVYSLSQKYQRYKPQYCQL